MQLKTLIQFGNMIAMSQIMRVDFEYYPFKSIIDTIIDPFQTKEKSLTNGKNHAEIFSPDMSFISEFSKQAYGIDGEPRNSISYGLV